MTPQAITVRVDGNDIATIPLPEGPPDRDSESTAFDLAYEARDVSADSEVALVLTELEEFPVTADGLSTLFAAMRSGNEAAIEAGITLIRTHVLRDEHPLALS